MKISYSISAVVRTKCPYCKQAPAYYYSTIYDDGGTDNIRPLPINKFSLFNPDLSWIFDPVHCRRPRLGWAHIGYAQKVSFRKNKKLKYAPHSKFKAILSCSCGKSTWYTPAYCRPRISHRTYEEKIKLGE